MPTYRDMAAFCRGKSFFSVIDLQKYYYQVKLDEPSQRHTLHEVDGKKFVYTVCPPGLHNASSCAATRRHADDDDTHGDTVSSVYTCTTRVP